MTERPSLRALVLTGWRALLRRSLLLGIAVTALLAGIAYVLPAHRLAHVPSDGSWLDLAAQRGEATFHSNAADGGYLPLLALAIAATAAFALRKSRFGAGFAAALLGGGAAFATAAAVLLTHLFSTITTTLAEDLFYLSLLGLFGASVLLLIAEPVCFLAERRRIIRAARPAPLPRAIATIAHAA